MSSQTRALLLTAIILATVASGITRAQESPRLKTGIFSTLRVSPRTGDIIGMELSVLPGASGYVLIAQGTEGAPGTPVVFSLTVTESGDAEFEVPAACPCALLEGRYGISIDDDGLTLRREGATAAGFLPRGDSFWQTF